MAFKCSDETVGMAASPSSPPSPLPDWGDSASVPAAPAVHSAAEHVGSMRLDDAGDVLRRYQYQGAGNLLLMRPRAPDAEHRSGWCRASDLTLWNVDVMPEDALKDLLRSGGVPDEAARVALRDTKYFTEPMSWGDSVDISVRGLSFEQPFQSIMISTPLNESKRKRQGRREYPVSPIAFSVCDEVDRAIQRQPIMRERGDCPADVFDACGKIDVSPEANPSIKWLQRKWLLLVVQGDAGVDGLREEFDEVLLVDVHRMRKEGMLHCMPPFCYETASYVHPATGEACKVRYNAMDAKWRESVIRQLQYCGIVRRVFPDEYSVYLIMRGVVVRDVVFWFSRVS